MSLETVEEEALSSEAQQILDLMGSRVRVDVTDGRHIMGVLYCVDGLQNVMLEDSITVRTEPETGEIKIRKTGCLAIGKEYQVKIYLLRTPPEEDVLECD